jgi:hypothetical protein
MPDQPSDTLRRLRLFAGVTLLLSVMAAELALSARQQSQTSDEGAHIFAGYEYWKNSDFGLNPEHPPLMKLIAALPLLRLPLRVAAVPDGEIRMVEFAAGREFLYGNDADQILWRTRMAATSLVLCLALAVFLFTRSIYGDGPAFLALALLVFEPNFLAHGALVTTDVGVTLGFVLGVGGFYLYLKRPSALRLIGAGLAVGLCIGVKHSGILIFPILLGIAIAELFSWRDLVTRTIPPGLTKNVLFHAGSLAVIAGISVVVLWSLYGFRFAARPAGLSMHPALPLYADLAGPFSSAIIVHIARWRLLPESYLYGLAAVFSLKWLPTFLLGKCYSVGQWFYFPTVFLIKSTIGFLVLCCLALLGLVFAQERLRRETIFLAVPAAIYLAVAMSSDINFGVRHLLPIYPFLIILVSGAVWTLGRRHKALAALVAVLVLFHAASSLRAFPNYIPYVNEAWGGSPRAYELLTDSNVDWGQGLKALKAYTDRHQIKHCWVGWNVPTVDPSYYGIPCKVLPGDFAASAQRQTTGSSSQGDDPVFVSASKVSQSLYRSDLPNPYRQFQNVVPSGLIANSVLVFDANIEVAQAPPAANEDVLARSSSPRETRSRRGGRGGDLP